MGPFPCLACTWVTGEKVPRGPGEDWWPGWWRVPCWATGRNTVELKEADVIFALQKM